ncbi:MAG: M23 family metallopeptidase [Deltaproteobacteria bacterium]|jgi:murein DD-endopeptidase MepM/ murein hydrolase activator NlpD|nr:M23 family metallopeptidase [Deltaproteobacteria bacterium]
MKLKLLLFPLLLACALLIVPRAFSQTFVPDLENPEAAVRVVPNPLDIGAPARVAIADPEVLVPPMGLFDNRPVFFFLTRNGWTGLFGADVMLTEGTYPLKINYEKNGEVFESVLDIVLAAKDYGVRVINVPESQVKLSAEDQARAAREKVLVDKALATVSPERLWSGEFLEPVNAQINSSFGRRTRMNGILNPRPHAGADYRAPEGAPVRAPASGRVILTGDHFFAGNSVYIDHGQGLISMYFHLSEILVSDGQMVNKGDEPIALVGKTGRVTGAHLHYGIYLNGARIDPSAFRKLTTTLED